MYVYFDIETIPGPVQPAPETIQAPANYKNQETIEKYQKGKVEEVWRGESLVSVKGRLLCLGYAIEGDKPIVLVADDNNTERDVLVTFWNAISEDIRLKWNSIHWVGFNCRSFDLNWLYHRAIKYTIPGLASAIPRKRYSDLVVDIREEWNGGDWQARGKLDEIAKFLGIKGKTAGIDGSKVFDYWQAGRVDEIAAYCAQDVELTRNVYRAMHPAVAA